MEHVLTEMRTVLSGDTLLDDPFFSHEETLVAFHRSAKSPAAAVERMRKTDAFRREQDVHRCLTDQALLSAEAEHRKIMLYGRFVDQKGRCWLLNRIGAWDVKAVCAMVSEDKDLFIRLHCVSMECLSELRRSHSGSGIAAVVDLKGLSRHFVSPHLISSLVALDKVDAAHYPHCMLKPLYVVNAPAAFAHLWAMLSRLLSKERRDALKIFSSVPEELVDEIGADYLPLALRGNRTDVEPYGAIAADAPAPATAVDVS